MNVKERVLLTTFSEQAPSKKPSAVHNEWEHHGDFASGLG